MLIDDLRSAFKRGQERFVDEWRELLRFPTVSADPRHDGDCRRCAEWLTAHLGAIGLQAELIETGAKPLVYGHLPGTPGKPAVLFYGHYDVQPPDPLSEWESPPFEPVVREGRMYARGAQDNKGQLFFVLKAIEFLLAEGRLSCPLHVLIEGEEESGSHVFFPTLARLKDRLQADILLTCDTGTPSAQSAAITMGLRGIVTLEARLHGLKSDLHSGIHGGVVPNPAQAMARLVASLHDQQGRIAVAGFYDGVLPPGEEELALARAVPFDEQAYVEAIVAPAVGGERGYGFLERAGFRPTLEVNGIHSGYGGQGAKTVIPREAIVKLSARLVAGQNPERCGELIVEHLRRHAPEGLQLEVSDVHVGGPALRVSPRSGAIEKAKRALAQISSAPVIRQWHGASIPVLAKLAEEVGAEPLLVGFGLDEDRIHAPNESFSLEQFEKGFLFAGVFLGELS